MNGYFHLPFRQRYNDMFTLITLPMPNRSAIHATGTSIARFNRTPIPTSPTSPV